MEEEKKGMWFYDEHGVIRVFYFNIYYKIL